MGRFLLLTVLLAGLAALALARIKLDPDLLKLFPEAGSALSAMKAYDANFAAYDDVVLTLEDSSAERAEEHARDLAENLAHRPDLVRKITWRPPWEASPAVLAPLVAYLWHNGDPDRLEQLAAELEAGAAKDRLEDSLETLASTADFAAVQRLSLDPLRLSETGSASLKPSGILRFPFTSRDGRFRVLRLEPEPPLASARDVAKWKEAVTSAVSDWKQENHVRDGAVPTRLTGRKIFIAAMTSDLQQDLFLSVILTAACICLLVFGLHRNVVPLLGILFVLALTLAMTLVVAALLFPTLNALSIGFAAILLGLVIDYGFLAWHEARNDPAPPRVLRRRLLPTISWAAITTAVVFLGLNLSSLPGVAQLGTLVACGTLIGALLMLLLYTRMLPALLPASPPPPVWGQHTSPWALNGTRALISTAILAILTTTVLVFRGPPALDTSSESIQPRACQPLDDFQNAVKRLGAGQLSFPLLIVEDSDAAMLERLREVEAALSDHPEVGAFTLPTAFWPDLTRQQSNQTTLARLAASGPGLLHEAENAGFTGDALEFLKSVTACWDAWSRSENAVVPDDPDSAWLLSRCLERSQPPYHALGLVTLRESHPSPSLVRSLADVHASFIGWAFLNDAILETIQHDLRHLVLPISAVLGIMLCFAFRSPRELILALCSLGLGIACFLALMSLLNWKWNLVNLMAFPLLLGAGIDYSIHILFALRRNGGDVRSTHAVVGRALLLCGSSTAIAFASLAPARYGGLSSLGLVCAAGILVVMLVSVYLLPQWWLLWNRPFANEKRQARRELSLAPLPKPGKGDEMGREGDRARMTTDKDSTQ